MLSITEIECIIHKARVEQMKGNISASLLLYTQAMNAIDEKMDGQLSKKDSEMLSTYMNNVLEEFDLISNSNPDVHITEMEQETGITDYGNFSSIQQQKQQQLRTPITAEPAYPNGRQFPPADYPNSNHVQTQPLNAPKQPLYPIQPSQPYPPYYQQPRPSCQETTQQMPSSQYSNPPTGYRNPPPVAAKPKMEMEKPQPDSNGISLLRGDSANGMNHSKETSHKKPSRELSTFERDIQTTWNRGVQNVKEYMKEPHVRLSDRIDV